MRGLLLVCLLSGCGPNLPSSWTLKETGITVEVQRSPLVITVRDRDGNPVVSSLGKGVHDGNGTVGWTTGKLFWDNIAIKGYYSFDNNLDPWRDDWSVTSAAQRLPTQLDLSLSGDGGKIDLVLSLRASALRVEAQFSGAPPRAWSAAFASPDDESFLGFGERFSRVDQRGVQLYSWAEEGGLGKNEQTPPGPINPWPNGETMTYYPVPFFVSTKGYGFWLDDTWRNEFRMASERPDAWRVWTIGPKLTYEIFVPIDGDTRPWPQQLVDLYTARTGRPMVPVEWAFGPRRRIGRQDSAQGKPEIQAMRDNHLALTATDDAEHFLPAGDDIGIESQLARWTADCAALGMRAIAYYNEYISADPSPLAADRQTGLDNHWFLYSADGSPLEVFLISGKPINLYTVDMTSPDAVAWFGKMFNRALNLGYFGWMYDFGEYVQPDVLASNGMTGEELHNLYPVLYDKAQFDALQAGPWANQWHAFGRSGYTGASQYMPVVWSGDPDASFDDAIGLPSMVRAGLNMGWSGVPHWGSDIGGYKCQGSGGSAADGELLARWIQYGSMGSDMHDENACANNTDGVPKATIWTAPDAMAAWSTYALLHTRLFPYLYANALEASRTGAPSQRSLFFEFPDASLAKIDDELMLGGSILAAPVVRRGERARNVVFPPGKWLAWPDGTLQEGGTTAMVDAPLAKLPLFLRADRLVPLLDPSIETLDDRPHPGVIGPSDVAGVYDVIGLVSQHAQFTLADGAVVEATLSGAFAPPSLPMAASEAELATCTGCWLQSGMRVRISVTGDASAGGLNLHDTTGRRVRWDLYLAP